MPILSALSAGIIVAVAIDLPDHGSYHRAVKVCDRQVQLLLTTTNTVQLQRAQYLIGDLHCSIERRLP